MTPMQLKTLRLIRQLLQEAYADHMLRGDGACRKSSEGRIEIYYPGLDDEGWSDSSCEAHGLVIYSYAFGPSRMHTWHKRMSERYISDTRDTYVDDPFAVALVDVKQWHADQLASENENEVVQDKPVVKTTSALQNIVLYLLKQPNYTCSSVTSSDIRVWARRPDANFLQLSQAVWNLQEECFIGTIGHTAKGHDSFYSQVLLTKKGQIYGRRYIDAINEGTLIYA